jgi:hypothetical protein
MQQMTGLSLPATLLPSNVRTFRARHTPCDNYHLRHRRGAVLAFEPRNAAGKQLLRAKSADGNKFVAIHMRWSSHHKGCHSHHRHVFVDRLSCAGPMVKGRGTGSSWALPW